MKKINAIIITFFFLFSGIGYNVLSECNNKTFLDYCNIRELPLLKKIPVEKWNKTFGGPGYEIGTSIILTDDDGYIFTGIKDADFYDDGGDCWLIKIDGTGNIEWEKTFGGTNSEISSEICVTNDHGFILAFSTRSFGSEDLDVCILKTDSDGNEEWNRTYGGSGRDQVTSIQQLTDQSYVVAGMTQSFNNNEAWLFKIDIQGDLLWSKTYGYNDNFGEYFMQVLQTNDQGLITVGSNYLDNQGNSDIYVVKTDINGQIEWEKQYGGLYSDGGLSISLTLDGGYILTGQSSQHPNESEDISLFKLDYLGTEVWRRYFGGSFFDTGSSVFQCNDNGYIISGQLSKNSQNTDAIILKTDSNGYKDWEIVFGGSESDGILDIHPTSDNGYIALGFTESFGAGGSDIWLIKFSSNANEKPNQPNRPSGPISGKINEEYFYTTSTTDPDGDQIFYLFDWDDESKNDWIGPYQSNEICEVSHTWIKKGDYEVRVKAKDNAGAESDWSDPLIIQMAKPRNYIFRLETKLSGRNNILDLLMKVLR